MKGPILSYVGWLLLAVILGIYLLGMGYAIYLCFNAGNLQFPEALGLTISSIQALLLTNLGALLGISVSKPASPVARAIMFHNPVNANRDAAALPEPTNPLDLREKIQLFALVIYIVVLVVCVAVWAISLFNSKNITLVELVSNSAKMFLGVALAYLTAVLSKP